MHMDLGVTVLQNVRFLVKEYFSENQLLMDESFIHVMVCVTFCRCKQGYKGCAGVVGWER